MDTTRLPPSRLARDTFLVHGHRGDSDALLPVNAMVIRGAEPVLVDTGAAQDRHSFLADVFALVEPADLRWVFVSHDDADHSGNVGAVLAAAPRAIAVVGSPVSGDSAVPENRVRCVGDGERFDAGDRQLVAVRPPVFDAPDTRGLFDPTTGVFWSADAFATCVRTPVVDVDELPRDEWAASMIVEQARIAPWLGLVDERRFAASLERMEGLGAVVVAGGHTPAIRGPAIDAALTIIRETPSSIPPLR